jgi:hypothetical protein
MGRARAKQLGHFYLFHGRPQDCEKQKEWAAQFVRRHWKEVEKHAVLPSNIRDDADLLWMAPPQEDDVTKDYRVDDWAPLWRFLSYRALRGGRRFVIVEDAHRISTVVANKLLKTLEEPEGEVTFLWLNPQGHQLLPTIESRAIGLSLTWPLAANSSQDQLQEVRSRLEAGDLSLATFLDEAKSGKFDPATLLNEFLTYEQLNEGSASLKQELLMLTKEWMEAQRYNQPIAPRLQWLHTLLSQRFRPGR